MKSKQTYGVLLGGRWTSSFADTYMMILHPMDRAKARVIDTTALKPKRKRRVKK